jgi:tape measure domain-containing protein
MAAQDAELKLKVSLDLGFFRQQLTGLGQAAAGYNLPVKVQFDQRSVQNELNALGANIRRRKYRLEVSTNLSAEIKKARDLAEALRGLPKGGGSERIAGVVETGFSQAALRKLGQNIKPLYKAAAEAGLVAFNEAIANNVRLIAKELSDVGKDSIEGLLNGLKSGDEKLKAAAKALGSALIKTIKGDLGIASPSKVFKAIGEDVGKGFELGAIASMDRAFDALEQKLQERLKKLQSILSLAPSRRSAFPFVATGGGLESGPVAREIDQAYAQIAQIQERRQGRLAAERGGLAQMAGRLLPPARDRSLPAARETILPGGSALDQVTRGFVQSLRDTRDTLARNFSANTYLPKATRALATSMDVATKQLSGTKIAGLLPSKEMMEPLRFQRAQQRAAQIDAENAARQQAEQALNQANLRGMFQGTPRINAPRVGQEETAIGRHIQNKIEQAIQNARQTLGFSIGPSSPYVPNPFAGAATVPPRQYFQAGGQAALPPAGGTGPFAELQRGTEEMLRRNERMIASTDRAMAALDRMIAARSGGGTLPPGGPPRQPPGGPPIQPPGDGGRGGALGFPLTDLPKNYLEIGKAIKGLDPILQRSSVPFSGAIRELGQEFGFAIKQVLLFGTAYKALAFFTDLPAQALNASKELQSFNNQLNAITGSSSNAQRSVQFINDTVAQFNVPLQSAREGFLRLYASMSPAGMEADTIENLFVGISQASATLGLSADQVDRVTYAFSQMASKGKVMSEEVTGQLGDVIPGALSLMADAAGLSMAEFKDAMEAGQVSGKAMEQLFTNLPIVMEERFGKGAAGAAKTLQGQLNDLATTTKRMYEAFEPLVTSIANQILPAVSAAMKDTQSAVEAFGMKIQGINPATNLLSENAQALYKNFEIVADTASSVGSIIQSLGGIFSTLGNIVSGALQLFNALAANPVGEFFVRLAVNIGIATAAINLFVKSGIIAATQQLLLFVGNIKLTIGALRVLITTSRAAKIAVGGIVAGTIMVGLEMLVTHLTKVRQETDKLKNSALLAADALSQMTFQQLVAQETTVKKMIQNLERLQAAAGGGLKITRPTKEQEAMARELGLPVAGRAGQRAISMVRAEGARRQLLEQLPQIREAMDRKFEAPTTAAITPIDLQEKEGKNKTGEGRQLSVDDLIGGDIKRKLDERRSKLEVALARELNRAASAINPEQAERMVKSAAKLLDIKYQIDAIDQTITAREAVREKIIASSKDKAAIALAFDEQTNNLKAARANLERDIEKAIIEQQGAAEQQARKEREEIERIRKEQAERIAENIKGLQDEIALLRTISKEEQNRLRIAQENKNATQEQLNQIYDLEKVRNNIKAVRETIDSFVTDTSSDYKGFLKEVISGEDAVESLKKFQEGLKDRVLTIFLDFAMAPVEKFFKEGLSKFAIENFFPKGAAENMQEGTKPSTSPIEAQDKNTTATDANTKALEANTAAMSGTGGTAPGPGQTTAAGTTGGFLTGTAALQTLPFNGQTSGMLQTLPFNGQTSGMLQTLPFNGESGFLSSLGINSEDIAASMTESAGAFSEQLGKVDASVFESANALGTAGTELGKEGAAGKKWHESLGQAVGGLGMAAGAVMGIVAGINQIKEGGTSNVLGGIGMIASMAGSLLGSFGGLFGGGGAAGASSIVQGVDVPIAQMPPGMQFANGGIAPGGFRAFANGGVVSGPTLGLVGEGKYNEAVVPLPDGRSIPVQLGGRSARDMMGGNAPGMPQTPSLSMKFETTKINGVEYVSREQLEQAMAETRRSSIAGGAQRGMSMTLDKIKQSPSTRSSIGIR